MIVFAGLALMILSEAATLAGLEPFLSWNTPICWTGFIIAADGLVYRARGDSWMRSNPREFAALCAASIPLWLVFEFFNRFIDNWYYVGLPEDRALRLFGYAWSFATIWPAIFEAAELVGVWRGRPRPARGPVAAPVPNRRRQLVFMLAGTAMLLWPIIWPSRYLAAPVWLGFIFLLDPVNARLGAASLEGDWSRGAYDRAINLVWAGVLCGFLWEFWNYWARAKWHYTVPIMSDVKLFEMPLAGYLGFPVFAIECFTMYEFLRVVLRRSIGFVPQQPHEPGRMIAL
jgi:hypothetical protein